MSPPTSAGWHADNSITAKASIRSPDYPVTLALDGTYHFPGANPRTTMGVATIEGFAGGRRGNATLAVGGF